MSLTPRRRVLAPLAVLAFGGLGFYLVRTWPRGEVEEAVINMATYGVVLVTGFALFGWAMIARPFARFISFGALALSFATFFGAIHFDILRFDGDMGMLLNNPFADRKSVIAEHRRTQNSENAEKVVLTPVQPNDSPAFRSADRTGVVAGPDLNRDWEHKPPREVWRVPVGAGYGGMSVVNGFLVTIEQRGDDEVIACYEAATGRERWNYAYPAAFREAMGGDGPRSTPTIHDGLVYSLGAKGDLVCLEGSTGELRWRTNILEGGKNLSWGMSGSPLVFDDFVVVNPGGVRAYHRLTGERAWESGTARAAYSSPMLAELDGVRQILMFDGDGLAGYTPTTGKQLWRFPWVTQQGINVAQPVVIGKDRVFIATGYGVGGALLEVRQDGEAWKARQLWRTKSITMRCKFTSPILWNERLIGLNDGILEMVEIREGRAVWKDDRRARRGEAWGHGQILRTGDLIVAQTEFGEFVLAQALADEVRELGRLQALPGRKTWNTPTLVDGRFYVRDAEEMACYDLRP